ncbi:type II toxin-antitoxin system VapC family toxin [Endozoicomonas sp. SM1973]|uniref:Type II toxin-antitoxin system VapC family toxin n=1 Tax=Spartinivicinus marinus TaxID=2994442 RepID=A0A853II92_9GAMM|nr:type II toxin-antitoxin system VapC family toxin [Spartinivicinus marinus]NYZ69127.1 type II toxin-antitoxin system VapC family toxin [Spartinivicinus marinus]
MYIIDTNVLSELRKIATGRADKNVMEWEQTVTPATMFLSSITILELEMGMLRAERKDTVQANRLKNWINNQVLPAFKGRILPVDTLVAQRCARLHVPNPKSERDAMIAATAFVHGMTVVTRNVKDFELTGVDLHNPFNSQ